MTKTRNVLIIEDEEILAQNLQTHLQRCGWNARIACTGKAAVIAASAFRPELILLDYHLPDMNGFQVLDAIGDAAHHCGCVLMTGHPSDTVMVEAKRHGIGHILSKPFPLAGLHSLLLAAVAEFGSNPEDGLQPSHFDFRGFATSPSLLENFATSD